MARFVALLRGVNIGKGNRVPMAAFRALLEAQGCTRVATLLNSGNAVFSASKRVAAAHAEAIGAALRENLGVDVMVTVETAAGFLAAVAGNPWDLAEAEHPRLLVAFAPSGAAIRGLSVLSPLLAPAETFHIGPHAAYLHCPGGILQSKAGSALIGKLGREVTARNWATVRKLEALLNDGAA